MTRCRPLVVVACALVACAPRPQTTTATTTSTTTSLSTLVPNEGWEQLGEYARHQMEVAQHGIRFARGFQYITGEIKNKGTSTVVFWEITFRFYDEKDNVVDTATLNNVLERLGPGDTKQWELMHRDDERIHHFLFELSDIRLAPAR